MYSRGAGELAPIGWYAHHHGRGHLDRAMAIAPRIESRHVTVMSSGAFAAPAGIGRIALPADLPTAGERAEPGPAFTHYAPRGVGGHSERMALIASWIAAHRPALFVVDVSCEVALLAALCGAPVCVVRQHGHRVDRPHRLAYEAARGLLAPWPSWLDAGFDDPWAERTVHTGFPVEPSVSRGLAQERVLTVVVGGGGSSLHSNLPIRWARALPQWRIVMLGRIDGVPGRDQLPPNLEFPGWVEDPRLALERSAVVIAHAGSGSVGSAAAAGRPLIVVPEGRPFDEQRDKAARLESTGTALVARSWPEAEELRVLLHRCESDPPRTASLAEAGDGADRAAAAIEVLAAAEEAQSTSSSDSSPAVGRRSRRTRSPSGFHSIQPRSSNAASHPSIGQKPQR